MNTECSICFNGEGQVTLSCGHAWCTNCLTTTFGLARQESNYPIRCCEVVPLDTVAHVLPPPLVQDLRTRFRMFETPAHLRVFCSNAVACGEFVPGTGIQGNVANCGGCGTRTCLSCGKASHEGECVQDEDEKVMEETAARNGWPRCPRCGVYTERVDGCPHMSCGCGFQFCVFCRRGWAECSGRCVEAQRDILLEETRGDEGVDEDVMVAMEAEDRRIDLMEEGPAQDTARAAWQAEFDRLTTRE